MSAVAADVHREEVRIDGPGLVRRLKARSEKTYDAAAREALSRGEEGERALVEAVDQSAGWRKWELAVALGHATGSVSLQALRKLLRETAPTEDARSAAMTYLAVRLGPGATSDLVNALEGSNTEHLNVALLALCATGDGSRWNDVLEWLGTYAANGRRRPLDPPEVGLAVAYLALTGSETSSQQLLEKVQQLWPKLKPVERAWIGTWWNPMEPETGPVGIPHAAMVDELRVWARSEFDDPAQHDYSP